MTRRKLGNLTGTPYSNIDNVQQDEQWCFDETGNWNRYDSSAGSLNQSRTHNPCNQITNITGPSGVADPLHDDAGNMTYGPSPSDWTTGYTMVWDAWNRLVRVKQGATVLADYAYDGLARRTTKTIGATVRHYYYDDRWRAVDEYAGATNDRRYLWGADSRYRMILRQRRISSGLSDERLYVLHDAMDPVALAEQDGDIVERFQYSPFGVTTFLNADFSVRTAGTSYAWDFLFHAEFRDAESGYYNYGYRYLDPVLGRWLSKDPIGQMGGKNEYALVSNRALTLVDYLGMIENGMDGDTCCDEDGNRVKKAWDNFGRRCCPSLMTKVAYEWKFPFDNPGDLLGHAQVRTYNQCWGIAMDSGWPQVLTGSFGFAADDMLFAVEFDACPDTVDRVDELIDADRADYLSDEGDGPSYIAMGGCSGYACMVLNSAAAWWHPGVIMPSIIPGTASPLNICGKPFEDFIVLPNPALR